MKVAFVSFNFGQYCIRLANALAQEAEILLMLPHSLAAPHLVQIDQRVRVHLFSPPRLRQPLQQTRMLFALLKQIRNFDPDVINLQTGHLWFDLALHFL